MDLINQDLWIKGLKQKAEDITRRVLLAFYVVPIHRITAFSVRKLDDGVLVLVNVDFYNYLTNERNDIIVPVFYSASKQEFEKPSIFYKDRRAFLISDTTLRSLFINYPISFPQINLFSPLAPLFYKNLQR